MMLRKEKNMERTDELSGGYKIIQDTDGFCFGTDAVLLSHFSMVKPGENYIDLCTGNGILPILIKEKFKPKSITAFEIQESVADLCRRNMTLNGIEAKIICDDIKNAPSHIENPADVITINPPYTPFGGGDVNKNDTKIIARHEIYCTLESIFTCVSKILKYGGRLYMVHSARRLSDIIYTAKLHKLEPKQIQFVHDGAEKNASIVLVSFIHHGGSEVTVLPPIKGNGGFSL